MLRRQVLLLVILADQPFIFQTQLVSHFDIIRNCETVQNLTIDVKNIRITRSARGDLLSTNITFKDDRMIPSDRSKSHAVVAVQRCRGKESSDTCVRFMEFKSSKVCEIVFSKLYGVAPFFACCKPSITSCPVKKGIYVCNNCMVDFGYFNMFPLIGYYWKASVKIYVGDKLWACVYAEGSFRRKRIM